MYTTCIFNRVYSTAVHYKSTKPNLLNLLNGSQLRKYKTILSMILFGAGVWSNTYSGFTVIIFFILIVLRASGLKATSSEA